MKTFGIYLLIFGLGSILLSFMNMEFRILMWIENWGPGVAWGIRIGMVVVGAVLVFLGKSKESAQPAA